MRRRTVLAVGSLVAGVALTVVGLRPGSTGAAGTAAAVAAAVSARTAGEAGDTCDAN